MNEEIRRTGKRNSPVITTYFLATVIGGLTLLGSSSFVPPAKTFKNLKVLASRISTKDLSSIMIDEFNDGLGVSCGFCHTKIEGSEKLNYASDANPEKQIARRMMKMTIDINRKYFGVKSPQIGQSSLVITCVSCHRGRPFPEKIQ